ncbi:unnamed protein product [Owenia fusiformis]|uniref:Calpain catalytic domain-containing protein n=1 Tax=Owenia fusiformis TaxID=6347 RepID=A0A8S4NN68_OWEFU|nr:unnamed protein product [Owenia fusiformis]
MFFDTRRRYNRGWGGSSANQDDGGFPGAVSGFFRNLGFGDPFANPWDKPRTTIRDIGPSRPTSRFTRPQEPPAPVEPDQPQSREVAGDGYAEIKAKCLEEGCLWDDPDFPADERSLYHENPPQAYNIEWLRPKEICDDPQMFVEGASRLDVNQGILGDCWLLAAVASLAQRKPLLYKVVPNDQTFDDGDYAGIFRFHFWQYGRWIEVIIDDRLPCSNGKLIYMHSDDKNEFWTPLLEKAYAKLNGDYESLSGGTTSEAMTDFTGGITDIVDFDRPEGVPDDMFDYMLQSFARESLIACSIPADPNELEARMDNGLVKGHAYSVTGVKKCNFATDYNQGEVNMVRVRNPWGNECEWKGMFSDGSPEWACIPEDDRAEMGLTFDDDGEFWMTFDDFASNFRKLELCHLGPNIFNQDEETRAKVWEMETIDGAWKRRVNAGGCRNYLDTFWTNPQYRVQLTEPDDESADGNTGTLILGVMQKERRKLRKQGQDNHAIGYAIYELDDPNCAPLDLNFFAANASVAKSPVFTNLREVASHHRLPLGNYVIVPSTFDPHLQADFMIRFYFEKPAVANEIDEETGVDETPRAEDPDDEISEDDLNELRELFKSVSGGDYEVDVYELKEILDAKFMPEFEFDGFSIDMCRSLVAIRDVSLTGKLSYREFTDLWKDLIFWRRVFKTYDAESVGYFNSFQLRRAFHDAGIRLSNSTFNAIVMRFSDREGNVRFNDFISCMARIKTMFGAFKGKNMGNSASFELDEFIQLTMYS